MKSREELAAEVHKLYCKEYLRQHRKEYWTKGVYALLDEKTKDFDRVIVNWAFKLALRLDDEVKR